MTVDGDVKPGEPENLEMALYRIARGNRTPFETIKSKTELPDLLDVPDSWSQDDRSQALVDLIRALAVDIDQDYRLALYAALRIVTGYEHKLGAEYAQHAAGWDTRSSLTQRLVEYRGYWNAMQTPPITENRRSALKDAGRKQWYAGRIDLSRRLKGEIERKNRLQDWQRPSQDSPAIPWPATAKPADEAESNDARPSATARHAGSDHCMPLARDLPLAGLVREALDAARAACAARGRAFYTPDLLHALFDIPGSGISACFDDAQPGMASRVRDWLVQSVNALTQGRPAPFRPFEWIERPEVQRAADLAATDGAAVVTEVYLLVGVLEGASTTREQLAEIPGLDLDHVKQVANERRRNSASVLKTPRLEHGFNQSA